MSNQSESRMYSEEELAELFHNTYEKLAPAFSYNTRTDTKVFDKESANGKLMIAVCKVILQSLQPKTEQVPYGFDLIKDVYNATHPELQPSPSIEKMLDEEYKNFDGHKVDFNIFKRGFIKGFKSNNHLDELEKWIKEEISGCDGGMYLDGYSDCCKDILKFIQELKTKQ